MARNPKQDANLKPIRKGDLTPEELAKRSHNGGIKSGQVRREKRDAKAAIRYLLQLPPSANLSADLEDMGLPETEQTNMAALQVQLFRQAMSGDLEAYQTIMKMGGYEPEENRKERESISSDRRRDIELEAKVSAIGGKKDGMSASIGMADEDGTGDVVIYLPEIEGQEEQDDQSPDDAGPEPAPAGGDAHAEDA